MVVATFVTDEDGDVDQDLDHRVHFCEDGREIRGNDVDSLSWWRDQKRKEGRRSGGRWRTHDLLYNNIQNRINEKRISHKFFLEGKSIILLNKTPPHKETRQINQKTLKDW